MLQEQVSEYLGVTSFKRKYPGEKDRYTHINTQSYALLVGEEAE